MDAEAITDPQGRRLCLCRPAVRQLNPQQELIHGLMERFRFDELPLPSIAVGANDIYACIRFFSYSPSLPQDIGAVLVAVESGEHKPRNKNKSQKKIKKSKRHIGPSGPLIGTHHPKGKKEKEKEKVIARFALIIAEPQH